MSVDFVPPPGIEYTSPYAGIGVPARSNITERRPARPGEPIGPYVARLNGLPPPHPDGLVRTRHRQGHHPQRQVARPPRPARTVPPGLLRQRPRRRSPAAARPRLRPPRRLGHPRAPQGRPVLRRATQQRWTPTGRQLAGTVDRVRLGQRRSPQQRDPPALQRPRCSSCRSANEAHTTRTATSRWSPTSPSPHDRRFFGGATTARTQSRRVYVRRCPRGSRWPRWPRDVPCRAWRSRPMRGDISGFGPRCWHLTLSATYAGSLAPISADHQPPLALHIHH